MDVQNVFNEIFEGEAESFKAFTISLFHLMSEHPEIALQLDQISQKKKGDFDWKDIYDLLQEKSCQDYFSSQILDVAAQHDWTQIKDTYIKWGQYVWITDHQLMDIGFWDTCPPSQNEADKLVLHHITVKRLAEIIDDINNCTDNRLIFSEAMMCFKNKCYTACASLLISLIDGVLIRNQYCGNLINLKTGLNAGKRIITEALKDRYWGTPGIFNLELLNFKVVIDTLFENANSFKQEPKRINRNFLHHGMNKRKVLRKDCIKLILLYRKALDFIYIDFKEATSCPPTSHT